MRHPSKPMIDHRFAVAARRGRGSWLPLPRTLGAKLMVVVLVTTLVALTVALGAMVAYDLQMYQRAWLADMGTQAELLGQTTAPALAFDDRKVARENLNLLRARPQVRQAAVYRANGEVFASYQASAADRTQLPAAPGPDGVRQQGRDVVVFKRVVSGGEVLGSVYLRAEHELYDRIADYAGIALGVAAGAMLVAWAFSAWLQRIITRPLRAVTHVARGVIDQKDYSRRAERLSDDEVGVLVDSFNGMLAEVERRTAETERSLRETASEVVERRAAQLEVMRLNTELEQRVRERTAELERSNRDLARASADAERANHAKSDFISSMSHELRTPLNAILGFGHLLGVQGDTLPPAKRAEFLQHIVKAGRHLLSLIDEILDLARIESSKVSLSLEAVQPADVLSECRTMIAAAADLRGLRLFFPAVELPAVVADRTRLKQVLLNLLSNAVKYNRDGGSVMVDSRVLDDGWLRITVRDTGLGLTAEQRASLFQPFNRLGQEGGTIEGTGIGLVVTKRLVELMGGRIDAESTVGVGSAFAVDLKVDTTAAVSRPAAVPANSALSRRRAEGTQPLLLYVEDNPANLLLVQEIVSLRGDLQQMSARDAVGGIELAREHVPALILMDINLPGISGEEALARLRADPRTAAIPVVAITANAMARDRARGLAAGFFGYLTKPIEVDALNEAIDAALAFRGTREA